MQIYRSSCNLVIDLREILDSGHTQLTLKIDAIYYKIKYMQSQLTKSEKWCQSY
jgi:hypothetical protein